MALQDERPDNLMEALSVVRDSGKCDLLDCSSVIAELYSNGQTEVASWLERHTEIYHEVVMKEFSQWLEAHSPYQGESIAQQAALVTGLDMPEDSFS